MRVVVVALIAAAAVVAAVALLTGPHSPTPPLPTNGVLVRSSVTPTNAFFGDTLAVRIDVLFDPHDVVAPRLSVTRGYSAYQVRGVPTVERRAVGHAKSVSYLLQLICLETSCLPGDPAKDPRQSFTLPSVRIRYGIIGGGRASAAVPLPAIDVGSRLTAQEAGTLLYPPHPPLAASLRPVPPTYRISPALLFALLLCASGLLFATFGALYWQYGPRPRRRHPPLSRLERALVLVERARIGGVIPDQRKALELLAGELGRTGEEELARSARVLAWSPASPPSDATTALEAEVRRRTNGSQ